MHRPMKPMLSATSSPRVFPQGSFLNTFFPEMFKLPTLLSFGSLLQLTLCAILPLRYAAVPVLAILLIALLTTVQQLLRPSSSPFLNGIVPGRATSQIPSASGQYGPGPGQGSLVVFQLGLQANHPLGMLAPHVQWVNAQAQAMMEDLEARREELGLLSVSSWRGTERDSNNTLLLTFFFKDVESIHRFAHEPLHKNTWTDFNKLKSNDIGIFHETYVVKEGGYESLYKNVNPMLLGRGQVRVHTAKEAVVGAGTEKDQWMNTLVSADTPGLKSFSKRMGNRDAREVSPSGSV